jgi:hypothetical protein
MRVGDLPISKPGHGDVCDLEAEISVHQNVPRLQSAVVPHHAGVQVVKTLK